MKIKFLNTIQYCILAAQTNNNMKKLSKEALQFIQKHHLRKGQFLGKEVIGGSLDLRSVTNIPEGFNPTVGGWLDLRSVTSIPEGFNPTVGGSLDLESVTSIPEGFNPTVGGSLDLRSVTNIPEGFNKQDFENKNIPFMKWGKGNGDYILCDDRFSKVISKRGNVWKLKDVGKDNQYYLVTDNRGRYAHGDTIKEAKADLIYKLSDRDKSEYEGVSITKKLDFEYCIEMYRVITGACAAGVKDFIKSKGIKQQKFTIKEIAKVTSDSYGNKEFKQFFKIK